MAWSNQGEAMYVKQDERKYIIQLVSLAKVLELTQERDSVPPYENCMETVLGLIKLITRPYYSLLMGLQFFCCNDRII